MTTQRFYDGQPGPDIRRELNNFEAILDGTVAAAQDASAAATSASVKAQQWADAAPGVEVETGKYSAKHWADRAQTTVTGGLIYRGSHSAASGAYPATPSLGDYYKISAAGTLGGVNYSVGDSIIYNGTNWDKIDSTDAVTSVAGRVGAVVLTKGDVGLSNVDNTSDANKAVLSATKLATAQTLAIGSTGKSFDGSAALSWSLAEIGAAPASHVGSGGAAHAAATTSVNGFMSAADKTKLDGIAAGAQVNTVTSVAGKTGAVTLAKADVGLGNVDNTSDANKPISTATQNALNSKEGTIASGTTDQYWRGDKTWRDFFTDVRAATLTGLSTATNAVVAATDTVLAAIGKLQAQVSAKFDKTGGDVNGNINFTGTARRITGDFSNATVANRTLFQTRVVNDATDLTIVPNGTATYAAVSVRSSDSANASGASLAVNGSSGAVELSSFRTGTGVHLPLRVIVGNVERLRIDLDTGNVLATSGAIGYGVGAGGTVVQDTSKSTAVTLNKPSGRITTHNAALAAGATATFLCFNSYVSATSCVVVSGIYVGGGSYPVNYQIDATQIDAGYFVMRIKNLSAGSLSDALVIQFNVHPGATS